MHVMCITKRKLHFSRQLSEILLEISNFWAISEGTNLSTIPPLENTSPLEFSRTTERIPRDDSVRILQWIDSWGNVSQKYFAWETTLRNSHGILREVPIEIPSENLSRQRLFVEISRKLLGKYFQECDILSVRRQNFSGKFTLFFTDSYIIFLPHCNLNFKGLFV